ncbi:uncharacterized protein LOC123466292 [Daphnia magna]|uniref:uncharacterized protein LOC123466292 n=1 Tax=Daphnia magna TaxID=35525 RepID=UPI001E1BAB8E|nr:uncharacterized protein LOC123466292 [Daphnia magna]
MLIGGAEPVVESWESYPCFKVIHRFDTYEEARQNLPRAEKGLPILPNDPSQTGRGCRQTTLKSRLLPGEVTTEQESDVSLNDESYFATTSKSLLKTNTTASKGKGIVKRSAPGPSKSSLLPIPPSGLQKKKKKEKPHDTNQVETIPKAINTPRSQQIQTSSSTTCLVPAHTSSNQPSARSITDNDSNESCLDFNSDCTDIKHNSQEINDEMLCTGFPNDTQGMSNGNMVQSFSMDTQYLTAPCRNGINENRKTSQSFP